MIPSPNSDVIIYIMMSSTVQILIAETLGTFILCTAILATGKAIYIGLALAAAITICGFASGGNFNPAVSFMMMLKGVISAEQLPLYVSAQLLGAFLAMTWYHKIPQKVSIHR